MNEKDLIGKTIEKIDIDGYGIEIRFTDGTEFVYNASDGGYSDWDISKGGKVKNVVMKSNQSSARIAEGR